MSSEEMSLIEILNNLDEEEDKIKEEFESRTNITRNYQTIDNEEVIKNMCVLSDIIKKEINEDKKNLLK